MFIFIYIMQLISILFNLSSYFILFDMHLYFTIILISLLFLFYFHLLVCL